MKLVNKCLTRQQPTNIVVPLSHVPIICFGFSTTACIFYTGACISSAACILSSAYCKTQNSERQIWYDLQRKIEKKIESFSDPDCWNFCLLWLSCHEESNYGSLLAIQQLAINSTPHLLSAHKRLIAIHWYPFVLGYLSGVRRVRCTEGRFVLFGFMFIRCITFSSSRSFGTTTRTTALYNAYNTNTSTTVGTRVLCSNSHPQTSLLRLVYQCQRTSSLDEH